MTMPPAGWYDDPEGSQRKRYWDGQAWTSHFHPPALPTPPSAESAPSEPSDQGARKVGLFGKKAEIERLEALLAESGLVTREEVRRQTEQIKAEASRDTEALRKEAAELRSELSQLRALIIETQEESALQEVGVYEFRHRLSDSVAYRYRIKVLRDRIKASAKPGEAVRGATNWVVNGSKTEGAKMVREYSKLMLRAYNNEAEDCVRGMRPYTLATTIDRLNKVRESISKLGRTMSLEVSPAYHALRIEELELTADFLAMQAREKEAEREAKARLREEERARREFEAETLRLRKEEAHYLAALEALRKGEFSDPDKIAELEAKLSATGQAIAGVQAKAANIRAGYVYVISNIGAFGPNVVKIGMTRRLSPMDRVRELGDASVPFIYDVHALIFSEDAVGLETSLHRRLSAQRVNMINARREFFYATPTEVRALLVEFAGSTLLEFRDDPEAVEWFQSEGARSRGDVPSEDGAVFDSLSEETVWPEGFTPPPSAGPAD